MKISLEKNKKKKTKKNHKADVIKKVFREKIFFSKINLLIYKVKSLVKSVIGLNFWANPTPTNKYEYIMN